MPPSDAIVLVWLAVVLLIALNGFAAGVAASLHAWKSRMPRAARALTAAVIAGLLPCSVLIFVFLDPVEFRPDGTDLLVSFGVLFSVGVIGSMPGAWLITRKLAQPGDDFRAFE